MSITPSDMASELLAIAGPELGQQVSVTVHPAVSHYLQGAFRDLLRELEETHGLQVIVSENPLLHEEQYEISE